VLAPPVVPKQIATNIMVHWNSSTEQSRASAFAMPLSAVELAKRAGLSLRQVQRMFQQSLDTTPSKYYLRLRLRRARELLLQSRMSITEIAIACGFQSTCHFRAQNAAVTFVASQP